MSITAERKQALITEYATKTGDTGSPEVQVAILSERIRNLTEHFKDHKTTIRAVACWSWSVSAAVCWIILRPRTAAVMNS